MYELSFTESLPFAINRYNARLFLVGEMLMWIFFFFFSKLSCLESLSIAPSLSHIDVIRGEGSSKFKVKKNS